MKILFVTPEVVPFAKTGGLADFSAAITASLAELGHEVKIAMPKYGFIETRQFGLKSTELSTKVTLGPIGAEKIHIWESSLPDKNVQVYLLENELFNRKGLYQENGKDYDDNDVRFILFSKGAICLCEAISWKPDIIHLNDWQTALVSVLLREKVGTRIFGNSCQPLTVLTIHNIAYQGIFPQEALTIAELGMQAFTMDRLEFYGRVNFLKGGIIYSNIVSTVSPTHAKEIQSAKFGFKLEGVIRERKEKLVGVLHGIDERIWNPSTDPYLAANYSSVNLSGKAECKSQLQEICAFNSRQNIPLIGMVSRLVSQKGIDLLIKALPTLMSYKVQIVILGTGQQSYHQELLELEQQHGQLFRTFLKFDEKLAHQIQAGSDILVIPSKYEPGGLTQIISLKYGTIPVARKTGGLADTLEDYSFVLQSGNSFLFDFYSPEALTRAIDRALHLYMCDPDAWQRLMKRGMETRYSWSESAVNWENVYENGLKARNEGGY